MPQIVVNQTASVLGQRSAVTPAVDWAVFYLCKRNPGLAQWLLYGVLRQILPTVVIMTANVRGQRNAVKLAVGDVASCFREGNLEPVQMSPLSAPCTIPQIAATLTTSVQDSRSAVRLSAGGPVFILRDMVKHNFLWPEGVPRPGAAVTPARCAWPHWGPTDLP